MPDDSLARIAHFHGAGSMSTRPFTIDSDVTLWRLTWSCTDEEQYPTIDIEGSDTIGVGGPGQHGGETYCYDNGRIHLEVNIKGSWTADVDIIERTDTPSQGSSLASGEPTDAMSPIQHAAGIPMPDDSLARIAHFHGAGSMSTRPFTIDSDVTLWRLTWSCTDEEQYPTIDIEGSDTIGVGGPGQHGGETYCYDNGRIHLEVNIKGSWTADVDIIERTETVGNDDANPQPTYGTERGNANAVPKAPSVDAGRPLTGDDQQTLMAELDSMVGLSAVKADVHALVDLLLVMRRRADAGLSVPDVARHLVFSGAPGTGKTSIARLLARIYNSLGYLRRPNVYEVARSDLVAGYIGQTALKTTEVFNKALGGVLFIDEAYSLSGSSMDGNGSDFGHEAIDTIVKLMEDHRDDIVVIAAGYPDRMELFLGSNPGLRSRFSRTIHFDDYGPDELVKIFDRFAEDGGYDVSESARLTLSQVFNRARRDDSFGNARAARQVFEDTVSRQASRIARDVTSTLEDLRLLLPEDVVASRPGPHRLKASDATEEIMHELDGLAGIVPVKEELRRLVNLARLNEERRQAGLESRSNARHLLFVGNPGTGKTTVARLLGQLYAALGVLARGHLVEASRADLVAGYVGQTALKTTALFNRARGGVLLIDEAYALSNHGAGVVGNDFGQEAIDTMVKLMEDYREEIIIVAAGYPDPMQRFLDSNPGLRSRFAITVTFPDLTADELVAAFVKFTVDANYILPGDALLARLRTIFAAAPRGPGFGNARLARQVFDDAVARQADRLAGVAMPTRADLTTLTEGDLPLHGPPGAEI
jgi:SpoVK/Ycf46/Vps4 family AAA+-type ATPase